MKGARVLIVDDAQDNLDSLQQALGKSGYEVLTATDGPRAMEIANTMLPELILLDVVMPDTNGYEVCRRLKREEATREIPVIFVTARGEIGDLITGFDAGAVDYIVKPFHQKEVLLRVRTHLEQNRLYRILREENRELEEKNLTLEEEIARRQILSGRLSHFTQQETQHWKPNSFVGQSRWVQMILEEIELLQAAHSMSVLITGESGTGKELIARAIHFGGQRRDGPFVPVNCSAVPRELADSLFFGHSKGTFTGADSDRDGYFALAEGGTLFLDEIGDMPQDLQPKLLRVLEDGCYRPLGDKIERMADVRIIAATNAGLQQGAFRQDLYFRLAQFTVEVPPLRQRREDIEPLARHFIQLLAGEMNLKPPELSSDVLQMLLEYDYPGNARELKNIVERALIKSRGQRIDPEHLNWGHHQVASDLPIDDSDCPPFAALPLDLAGHLAEEELVQRALKQSDHNISAAARLLNTNRPRIYSVLKRLEARRLPG